MSGNSLSNTQRALGVCEYVFSFSLFFKCNFTLWASASLDRGGVFNQIYRSSWINPPETPYHFRPPQVLSHFIVEDDTHTQSKDICGWLEALCRRCRALAGSALHYFFFPSSYRRAGLRSLPLMGFNRVRSVHMVWRSMARLVRVSAMFWEFFHPLGSQRRKRIVFLSCSRNEIEIVCFNRIRE